MKEICIDAKTSLNQIEQVNPRNFSCKWHQMITSANQRLELWGNPMTFNDVMPIFRSHETGFPEQVRNLTSESRSGLTEFNYLDYIKID